MRAGQLDRQIIVEYMETSLDPTYGTEIVTWQPLVSLPGSPRVAAPLWANWQDVLPSRSEAVTQGLAVARNQSRLRLRYRSDITSAMRVTDVATSIVYQIVGGPAEIGGRQAFLEMMLERYSS